MFVNTNRYLILYSQGLSLKRHLNFPANFIAIDFRRTTYRWVLQFEYLEHLTSKSLFDSNFFFKSVLTSYTNRKKNEMMTSISYFSIRQEKNPNIICRKVTPMPSEFKCFMEFSFTHIIHFFIIHFLSFETIWQCVMCNRKIPVIKAIALWQNMF